METPPVSLYAETLTEPLGEKSMRPRLGIKGELQKLFIANPMQMEVIRFRRRFINVTSSPKLNQTLVGLVGFSYLLILGLLATIRQDMPMGAVAIFQLALMMLTAIVGSHAAIAGEKDRRSWDLLQVAPITQYQIVVGKFLGMASLMLGIQAAFLPALAMSRIPSHSWLEFIRNIFLAELLCFVVGLFASAATIYLSSKMKNANMTLVTALAGGLGIYTLAPMLASLFLTGPGSMDLFAGLYHPFYWLAALLTEHWSPSAMAAFVGSYWGAIIGIFGYLALTGLALFSTGHRLTKQRGRE